MDLFPRILSMILMVVAIGSLIEAYRISQLSDQSYPWSPCNSFEATKKNCPLGQACLKLKAYKSYAWNWAMRCQSREEYIQRVEYSYGLNK